MECLIFSDTHGNYPLAIQAVMQAGPFDRIFHLGDGIDDAVMLERLFSQQVAKVAGNCDAPGGHPRETLTVLAGLSILITHGDCYRVKAGLSHLHRRATSVNAKVVLYGHTHRAAIDEMDGILFVNPGSLHVSSHAKSYARLSIVQEGPSAVIVPVGDGDDTFS